MHRTPNRSDYLHKPDDREEQPTIKKPQSLVAGEEVLSENTPHKLRTPIEPRQPDNDRNDGRRNIGRRNLSPNNLAAHSVGNRRAQIGSQRAQPTPTWANYLNHLGEQAAAKPENQHATRRQSLRRLAAIETRAMPGDATYRPITWPAIP